MATIGIKHNKPAKLVKAIIEGKPIKQAVLEARNMKPDMVITDRMVQEYISRNKRDIVTLLDGCGLTLDYANNHLKDIIDSPIQPIVVDGVIEYAPNKALKLEGLKTLYKLHKALGLDNLTIQTHNNNFNIDIEHVDKLSLVADRFQSLSDSLKTNKDVQDGEIV